MTGHRLARVRIANDLLMHWFKVGAVGFLVTHNQLPADARIVGTRLEGEAVELVLYSESFPPLTLLDEIPFIEPIFKCRVVADHSLIAPSEN